MGLLVPAFGCVTLPRSDVSPAHLAYAVTFRPGELEIEVRAVRSAPTRFLFTEPGSVAKVQVEHPGGPSLLRVALDGAVELPDGWTSIRYRWSLPRGRGLTSGAGEPDAFVVAGRSYLLRPYVCTDADVATLQVRGVEALLPWEPSSDGRWRLRMTDLVDSGFHAFGGRRCARRAGGARVEVALLGGHAAASDGALCDWVGQASREVLTVLPEFPHRRVSVAVVAVDSDEPSPFGMVLYSAPPSFAILTGRSAPADAFQSDWVAVHELLHLLHPPFVPKEPWLAEGLATYYTEVARARSGRQSAARAWRELLDGFDRGEAQAGGGSMEAATRGHGELGFLALYWSGALFCLDLDVGIRRATNGRSSLDDVLARLGPQKAIDLPAFARAVDEVAGTALFEATLRRHRAGPAFAQRSTLEQSLGLMRRGEVVQLNDGPDAAIRDAIVAKRPDS